MDNTLLPIHVTAAMATYLWFIACVVQNVRVCLGRKANPRVAVAACEAGLFAAAVTMATGSYWAYHAWGTAWVWEPRLTGMFLMTLFFVSWRIAVAVLGAEAVSNRRMTASLIVLGLPSMAFTHLAARLMGGLHPSGMSHVERGPELWVGFAVAGIVEIAAGLAWIWWRTKKGGRIPEAEPRE